MVYRDTVRMIETFPRGVGIGKNCRFDHAHNDYLETAAEWGLAAAIPFWAGIGIVFVLLVRLLMRSHFVEEQGILVACTGSIFTILVHSLTDFNLQIPSNAMLFFGFVGIGLGILFRKTDESAVLAE